MIREKLVLVFDAGTQSTRGFLFNKRGEIVAMAKVKNFVSFSTEPGFQEKHAETYWQEICDVSRKLRASAGDLWNDIEAVSITMLRNCQLCVDKDIKPLRPVITWMDQRLATFDKPYNMVQRFLFRLANMSDVTKSQYETSFANWIAEHEPDIWAMTYKYMPISTYINYKLIGKVVDSKSNAVGRIPYDYKKRDWMKSTDLTFNIFGVSVDKCFDLVEPGTTMGYITRECAEATGIREGLPLIATGSDKACETIGCGCIGEHTASLSFGTAANIQMTVDRFMNPQKMMPSFTSAAPNMYNPEIQMFRGFWMVTWFKDEFAELEKSEAVRRGVPVEKVLDEMLDKVPVGSNGLVLQPYWGPGLLTPRAKGSIIGFSDVHKKEHVYRAIIEGLGYSLYDSMRQIERRGHFDINKIIVSGGGSTSDAVCQIMADIFGLPVMRPHTFETSGLGSAIVTFLALGEYQNIYEAIDSMVRMNDTFIPNIDHHDTYMNIYDKVYSKLYNKVKKLYEDIYDIV